MYENYKCRKCLSESILLTEDIDRMKADERYLSCPYCGSEEIIFQGKYDDLIKCMQGGEIDLRKV